MAKRRADLPTVNAVPVPLSIEKRVLAFIVGIENYQGRGVGVKLPNVDFARNDAEVFAKVLKDIYPREHLEVHLCLDSDATYGSLRYELKQAVESLEKGDLFIFYYAGHGFHELHGNRITTWDTNATNIEDTTLLLREVLMDPLAASPCQQALVFVDACAAGFTSLVPSRQVITAMDPTELKEFLRSATYCAMFLSCEPGQKSYHSNELKHGIWTHFLLKALRGDAEEALGPQRFLTDVGLRDYLRQQVPRYITKSMIVSSTQRPMAILASSNTFCIREVPEAAIPVAPAGDLACVSMMVKQDYLESVERGQIRSLPGFNKKQHFVPDRVSDAVTNFIRQLLQEKVAQEVQDLYETTKSAFNYRSRDIQRSSDDGQGSLETEAFRFSIDPHQHSEAESDYVIVRRLSLREGWRDHIDALDRVFGARFEKVVVVVEADPSAYQDLVDFFEDVEDAHGGKLTDEEHKCRITYVDPEGTKITIDLERGRITLAGLVRRQEPSVLLDRARRYRFGLRGNSLLLLSNS